MALDPVKNLAKVTVSTGYDVDDTSIVLTAGHGAKLPAPATDGEFNLVWWNSTDYPDPADDPNAEIVRITARSTDTLTITRAQEDTSAATHNTAGKTYKMILAPTGKTISDILLNVYPVGAIYISVVSTSPATLFGGTWAVFGAGKALVGLDSADTDFDTVEETRGEKKHTLTVAEMPVHTHTQYNHVLQDNDAGGTQRYHVNTGASIATGSAGGGAPHNNIQPSIVVYMWKRTA